MTWLMPSTSMPRAAMSVATSVRTLPARKAASTRSRWPCDLLPWIASAARPGLFERADHLVGAVLGAGEDQRAVDRLLPQHLGQQRRLAGAVDVNDPLIDLLDRRGLGRHGDPHRIAQHPLGELGDLARHGGREEQGLPAWRQLADDRADVVDEAHVEHAVGFVEHENLDAVEPHGAVLHQVEQPAGRRHQDVDAADQIADLRLIGTPPMASVTRGRT